MYLSIQVARLQTHASTMGQFARNVQKSGEPIHVLSIEL